jgi:hypothetical protein
MVLALTGLAMLGVSSQWIGILGASMVLLGPIVWGWLRHLHGSSAFDHLPFGDEGNRR